MQKLLKNSIKTWIIFLVTMVTVSLFSGCKSDSNPTGIDNNNGGTNSITLNGDGWSNSTLTISTSTSTYGVSANATVISISSSDGISFLIYVTGNQAGTFDFNDLNSDTAIGIYITSGTGQNLKYYLSSQNSGSITITNYGAVGAKVSGTFTGKVYNAVTQAEVSVSGTFSATRTVDVP